MPTRRSVFLRLVALITVLFVLGTAGMMAVVFTTLQSRAEAEAKAEVGRQLESLLKVNESKRLAEEIHWRAAVFADGSNGALILAHARGDGGCALEGANIVDACPVGRLVAWPDAAPDADGWIRATVALKSGGDVPTLARVATHHTGDRLLVGRDLSGDRGKWRELALRLAAIFGATAAFGIVGGVAIARGVTQRLRRIDAFCAEVGAGAVGRRLPARPGGDEFDRLSEAINRMLGRIGDLMHLNQNVVDQVAHDMLTPLTGTQLRLQRLAKRADDRRLCDELDQASEELGQAQRMFRSMTELARLSSSEGPATDPVDLAEVGADAVDMLEAVAEDRGIALETALDPAPLTGSAQLLRQAVVNLIANAIKFQDAGGAVRVASGRDARDVWIEVSDTGPGIPAEERAFVVQRLYRRDRDRGIEGHGLGLAWVDAIARLHGMSLTFDDARPGADRPGLRVRLAAKV